MPHLRTQIHQPIVNRQIRRKPVIMCIVKMHLADQTRQISVIRKMMCHRAIPPIQPITVVNCPRIMSIQTRQQRHTRSRTHRIGTIGILKPHPTRSHAIYHRRRHRIIPGTRHPIRAVLIGHQNQNIGTITIIQDITSKLKKPILQALRPANPAGHPTLSTTRYNFGPFHNPATAMPGTFGKSGIRPVSKGQFPYPAKYPQPRTSPAIHPLA